jgi:hypothetical protein
MPGARWHALNPVSARCWHVKKLATLLGFADPCSR